MNAMLNIIEITSGKYKFIILFENNNSKEFELPIDMLRNSAEMIGFHFESNGKLLEPSDFRVISREVYNTVIVKPGKQVSIDFIGTVEMRSEKYHYISFNNASYPIIPGEKYKVWFSLNGYISKPIEIIF